MTNILKNLRVFFGEEFGHFGGEEGVVLGVEDAH